MLEAKNDFAQAQKMVKVRLAKHGKRNDPHYKIVAIEKSRKNSGKALADLGYWHPKSGDKEVDKKGIAQWEAKGAQVSKAVKDLY